MEQNKSKALRNWLIFGATAIVTFILGLLASSITERRVEAQYVYKPQVQINETEPRNQVWGKNFPLEYTSWQQTQDTSYQSKYNGNAMIDMLEEDPRLVVLWAGYLFSRDYNQSRGHYYSIEDVWKTLRTGAPNNKEEGPQPSTCWTCKSPDVPRLMKEKGIVEFYKGKWASLVNEVVNPIGCLDCHDPKTMELHISRPALVEAFDRQGIDITKATHQQMRTLVCAQCHVEYYFDKKRYEGAQYLTFPWDKGMTVEAMESYYDSIQFTDWVHALSRTPMLKAQHPDYEVFMMGVHYKRGVSCADCHMPYNTVGGQKFTDHHIQSPLNNIANSCQVCHREDAEKLIRDVYERQDKIIQNRDKLEEILVMSHIEAKKCWDLGANEEQMKDILQDIRKAQWRWDFAAAGHGNSFHAPVEISRIIADGINIAQEARIKLARLLYSLGQKEPLQYPDISTKQKAQLYIGLDIPKYKVEKQEFLTNVLPLWLKEAKDREAKMEIKYF